MWRTKEFLTAWDKPKKNVAEDARAKKRKGREEKRCTSYSGSSSRMLRVADVSFFCLDCKEKIGEQKNKVKKKRSTRLATRKLKRVFLKMTYPPLSGKRKMRSCLAFVASSLTSKGSICRRPRSNKLGLTSRLRLGWTFLTRCRNICYCNFFLPTERIIASMPIPPFVLLIPLKDGWPVLFPGIC